MLIFRRKERIKSDARWDLSFGWCRVGWGFDLYLVPKAQSCTATFVMQERLCWTPEQGQERRVGENYRREMRAHKEGAICVSPLSLPSFVNIQTSPSSPWRRQWWERYIIWCLVAGMWLNRPMKEITFESFTAWKAVSAGVPFIMFTLTYYPSFAGRVDVAIAVGIPL